ncbi:DUF6368 family protein [Streptomyces sp. PmtA]|uniref:DUF6368 family protein n=1 Tax=Streptomyces sp. PmtA TaxID=3074275 RepID=UPI003014EE60
MPGPAVSLLLFARLTDAQWEDAESRPGTFRRPVEPDVFAEYDFGGCERRPGQEAVVSAHCQGRHHHRLLGHPARRLGALIGGNGPLGHRYSVHGGGPEPDAAPLAATRALVRGVDGVVHEIPYAARGHQVEYTHVCDAAFVESWLRHPEFRTVG